MMSAQGFQVTEGADLVRGHQPGIARDVRCQDRRQAPGYAVNR